jgi:HSP20 family protein
LTNLNSIAVLGHEGGSKMKQLTRTSPRDSIWNYLADMDRAFEGFWDTPRTLEDQAPTFAPAVDVHETNDNYILSLDVPGLKESDVKIDVQDSRLTISGERKAEKTENDKSFRRFERTYGRFERSFQLPQEADAQGIKAAMENGVLEILIPKKEVSKPRAVEIEAKKGGLFSRLVGKKETPKTEDAH